MQAKLVIPAYVAWFPPTILGAALGWSRWIILALLIPGLIWYGATQGMRCYKEVRAADPKAPLGQRVPVLYAASLFVVAIAFLPGRLVGIFIVTGFVLVDLMWWRRTSRRSDKNGRPVAQSE